MQSFADAVESVFEQTAVPAQRASLLAAAWSACLPGHNVSVVILEDPRTFSDADGPEVDLHNLLTREARADETNGQHSSRDRSQAIVPVAFREQLWGAAAVKGTTLPETALRELTEGCRYLGLRLALEKESRQRGWCEEQFLQQRHQADIGEISRPVVHELYNLLNTLTLQMEVLKLKYPDASSADLASLKKQVLGMVEVLKWFRQYRVTMNRLTQDLDLNQQVRFVVARLQQERSLPARVDMNLDSRPVFVHGSTMDVERLLRFLLTNAGVAQDSGSIRVGTKLTEKAALLIVEEFQPGSDWELQQTVNTERGKTDVSFALELAASKMLVERLRGKVRVEPLAQNARIVIELPARTAPQVTT